MEENEDYLLVEKQPTTVEMFDAGLLRSIEDLKTDRGDCQKPS